MSERIKLFTQKRTSLKSQITNLSKLLDKGKLDSATLKLRIARLTDLYHTYEDHNDELAVLEPEAGHQDKFASIQERFYSLAGKIKNILNVASSSSADNSTLNDETRSDNTGITMPVKKQRIKLPEAPLPTFNGKYENWLSFKNAFRSMIGSQTDLSNVNKLHYLKSALIGEAANKIRIFSIDGINYSNA